MRVRDWKQKINLMFAQDPNSRSILYARNVVSLIDRPDSHLGRQPFIGRWHLSRGASQSPWLYIALTAPQSWNQWGLAHTVQTPDWSVLWGRGVSRVCTCSLPVCLVLFSPSPTFKQSCLFKTGDSDWKWIEALFSPSSSPPPPPKALFPKQSFWVTTQIKIHHFLPKKYFKRLSPHWDLIFNLFYVLLCFKTSKHTSKTFQKLW